MDRSQPRAGALRRAVLADPRLWGALTAVVALGLYLSALQWDVNGCQHPYTTDVGEIQNALPRWGTLHYPGYPLYSFLGSLSVTLLRLVGVAPAAGSSLFSAVWGAVSAVLLVALARELGAASYWAALGALVASLATSVWVDSCLAEIHTMGMALFLAVLYCALRFGRLGGQRDLQRLALALSLGVMHQRSMILIAPAVLLLIWSRWPEVRRGLLPAAGLAALGPLTYLYLPLRAWQRAEWTFGAVGSWRGFLQIFGDTKVERVVAIPQDPAGWLARGRILAGLLHDDLWLPVLAVGLAGLLLVPWRRGAWRRPVAMTLAWLPAVPLSLMIWEGKVSDALLAAKLPIIVLAGVGLALAAQALGELDWRLAPVAAAALLAIVAAQVRLHRPAVLAITRDGSAERVIAMAEQVALPRGGPPTTFMALWGHSYWALTYAQAYEGRLPGLALVDHNAQMSDIARRGRLLTFCETLYHFGPDWWDERLGGRAHLSSPAPGILAISPAAARELAVPAGAALDLENGVRIVSAYVKARDDRQWLLTVYWQADRRLGVDYSIAVHLLAADPPAGPADILDQADRNHPVCGWYPTTRWEPGEIVYETYLLTAPPQSRACAVRVAMYRVLGDGQFENTPWLTLRLE